MMTLRLWKRGSPIHAYRPRIKLRLRSGRITEGCSSRQTTLETLSQCGDLAPGVLSRISHLSLSPLQGAGILIES
jgi:hypothetical protein